MITLAVQLERPSPKALGQYDRAQKYRILRDNTSQTRDKLIAWIEDQGLSDEVYRIGDPTAFNLLFIDATPEVAERLAKAPGVVSVSASEDIEVDLPKPRRKGQNPQRGQLEIRPSSPALPLGAKTQFTVLPDQDVTWSYGTKDLGMLTAGGHYTAPSDEDMAGRQITLRATSTRDETKFAEVTITLVEELRVVPPKAQVALGEQQAFHVEPGAEVTWAIEPSRLGHIEAATGVYTAPGDGEHKKARAGAKVTVRATLVGDPTTFATAKVTLVK
jgi:hypothetical protein